ncbi:MAG: GyrI-like domain-containing protein [Planctomycetota bacterium]
MECSIETLTPQPALGIKTQTTIAEIGEKLGQIMAELGPAAGDLATGPVLARWHEWETDRGLMEVALPVSEPAPGSGRIEASELPGGRAVVATHVGPYATLKDSWIAVTAWMKEQGLEGTAAPWEQYLDDPCTTAPESLRTLIVWPIG